MSEVGRYPKQVFWSDEDGGFVGLVPDLPGCSAFGESEAEVLRELDDAIAVWVDAAETAGNAVPRASKPALRSRYSGKLLLSVPRSLHENLVESARREAVSLNQYAVYLLARNAASSGSAGVAAPPSKSERRDDGNTANPAVEGAESD